MAAVSASVSMPGTDIRWSWMYFPAKRRICALASPLPSAVTRLLYSLERYACTSFNTEAKSLPSASASKNRPWVRSVLASRLGAAQASSVSGDASLPADSFLGDSAFSAGICRISPTAGSQMSSACVPASVRIFLPSFVCGEMARLPSPFS